jgi:endonuclease-3 related protein
MNDTCSIYYTLLEVYGLQGWWPVSSMAGKSGFNQRGYHPGIYSVPENSQQLLEILTGTLLTQNTSWSNAEKALCNLQTSGVFSPEHILAFSEEELGLLIRSSGYYRQKARRLQFFSEFLLAHPETPDRNTLLTLRGIGPETADSMLLYAWHVPVFVVDTYTIRFFVRFGLLKGSTFPRQASKRYEYVQNYIMHQLSAFKEQEVFLIQEYHALLVYHAKMHCRLIPDCVACPLEQVCKKMI